MCALALAGCAVQPQPGDPAVTARIVGACVNSGLFKIADGLVAAAVPAASLPIAVVNAGVDRVCANPAVFSADLSTVEWVAKNLAGKL
jgi:hypothetical protein